MFELEEQGVPRVGMTSTDLASQQRNIPKY